MEALVRRGLAAGLGREPDTNTIAAALAVFDRCYADNLFVSSHVYPGVAETLATLRAGGLRLACVTNKRERFANALLQSAGLATALDVVIGGDTLAHKKPHPEPLLAAAAANGVDPAQSVMVGDSVNDRDSAAGAGFTFVFAAYGYADPDDPALNQGNHVIHAFSALPELLCG